MATLISIKAKLKTILETKEGAGEPLNEVYGYFEVQSQKFPFASIEILDIKEVRLDTASNLILAKWLIKVVLQDENNENVSTLRLSIMKELTNLFRTSENIDTLDNEITKLDVESVIAFNQYEDMPLTGFDIILMTEFVQTIS